MNFSRKDWIRFFHRLVENLFHDVWYPTVGIGLGLAIISPEANVVDCLVTASALFMLISCVALLCHFLGWFISLSIED